MNRRRAPFACLAACLAAGAGALAQSPAPFTSEHAARGVTYNMLLSVPISTPMDGFGMAAADLDGDGYGDGANPIIACTAGLLEAHVPGDCDDGEGAAHPGNAEVYDGIDNKCAEGVDEGVTTSF